MKTLPQFFTTVTPTLLPEKVLAFYKWLFAIIRKLLTNGKPKKTITSILILGVGILVLVTVVTALFLLTGRVFVELFGWLFFPFPKRLFKKKNRSTQNT
jgi:hypothetical protein